MKRCPNTIVSVEDIRIHKYKETSSLILVEEYAKEKEDLIALITALNFVIVENVSHANFKEVQ